MTESHTSSTSAPKWLALMTGVIVTGGLVWRGRPVLTQLYPGKVFVFAFFSLISVNMVVLLITLFVSLIKTRAIDLRPLSDDQKERAIERVMVPALRGRITPPHTVASVLLFANAIFEGMIGGAIVAWIIEFALGRLPQT